MLPWLLIAAALPAAALDAPGRVPAVTPIPGYSHGPNLGFRLVAQPAFEPGQVRRSGMIVEAPVAPNAALGLGLFKLRARKPSMAEPRFEGRKPTAKKVGFSFRLQF